MQEKELMEKIKNVNVITSGVDDWTTKLLIR